MVKVRRMGADFVIDYINNTFDDSLSEEEWDQYLIDFTVRRVDQIFEYFIDEDLPTEEQFEIKKQLAIDISEAEYMFISSVIQDDDQWDSVDDIIDRYEVWFDKEFVNSELYKLYHTTDAVSSITSDIWKDM
jgi:hypothetical protein